MRFQTYSVRGLAILAALGGLACSAELESYTADAESGSTHALVSVERSVGADGSERARALATFVQLPADADARGVLESVGIKLALPPVGQCRSTASPTTAYRGRVELIQAGDVRLSAAGNTAVLAPHAFPAVTDVVSGIVYTTRDQSAEPFPTDSEYTLRVDGELGPLAVSRRAPSELRAVSVNGLPLADSTEISASQPLDLTWSVGSATDLVWVEVSAEDGSATYCSFRDDLGAATVPAGVLASGSSRLALHRVRVAEFSSPGLALGELRFDFDVSASVTITP